MGDSIKTYSLYTLVTWFSYLTLANAATIASVLENTGGSGILCKRGTPTTTNYPGGKFCCIIV
uniref:Secreted protein n=1 Tax=Phakopsora pachyrhizi TaxID=170000 RepID=A0A0S1MJS9_PHAPC